MLLNLKDRNKI